MARLEQQLWARRSHKTVLRAWSGLADLQTCADTLAAMRAARSVAPVLLPCPSNKRILVIAPHPDDEVIGPGGTLIGAIDNGCTVRTVYLTSGGPDPATAHQRETEAKASASHCGYDTRFLRLAGLAEGVDDDAIAATAAAVAEYQPDLLFVTFFADDHAEHQRASQVLTMAHDGGLLDGSIEVWAYQVYTAVIANVIVDTTETQELKSTAIRLFKSQMQRRDWAHFSAGLSAYNSRFLPGRQARHAEIFHVAPLRDYADLCRPYFHAG